MTLNEKLKYINEFEAGKGVNDWYNSVELLYRLNIISIEGESKLVNLVQNCSFTSPHTNEYILLVNLIYKIIKKHNDNTGKV